jgi:DNA invertase Pin-like site-specific DNA recombinase
MNAAIYVRVSTDEGRQDINNQRNPLLKLAEALNLKVIKEYIDYASGGNSNRPQFQQMLRDAENHKFDMVLIWALDRFSREGILNTLSYLRRLRQNKVAIKSLQESWLDTREEGMGELLIAIFSWVAHQEKKRISERVKAGLKGKSNVGKRGKDKKTRRKSGYLLRWVKERKAKDEKKGIHKPMEEYEQTPPK